MWLSDFQLVLPDRVVPQGALRIEDGYIAEIVEGAAPRADLTGLGLALLPGIVDLHGDMLEREIEPRPKAILPTEIALFELDKRMVATGITTAFAAVSFHQTTLNPLRSDESARRIIEEVNRLRDSLLADFRVHARFEVTNPSAGPVLLALIDAGHVHLVSLTDHTPGQGQYRDIERYVQTMIEWRKMRAGLVQTEDELREQVQRAQTRPRDWDVVREVARLASRHAIPLASHDDDSEAKVDFVCGLGATISEFPVSLESAHAAKARRMRVIMGAPNALLGKSNTNNLAALDGIRAGVVDILAADYHPASLLQSAHRIAIEGLLPWHEAVKLITLHPADAAGLTDRGSLQVGKLADLALVEMAGRPRVRATLRRGELIYWDGSITSAPPGACRDNPNTLPGRRAPSILV
jgi:alpha-D-ribose 1-methylphosphonate 5-triphosphate diphosphatase